MSPAAQALAQYAQVLGLIAAGGIWFAKGAHQRERDRGDRLEAKNEQLANLIIERVIPALTSSSDANKQAVEVLRDIQRERRGRKGRDADLQ
jgi:hypothetical protein